MNFTSTIAISVNSMQLFKCPGLVFITNRRNVGPLCCPAVNSIEHRTEVGRCRLNDTLPVGVSNLLNFHSRCHRSLHLYFIWINTIFFYLWYFGNDLCTFFWLLNSYNSCSFLVCPLLHISVFLAFLSHSIFCDFSFSNVCIPYSVSISSWFIYFSVMRNVSADSLSVCSYW